MVSEVVKIRLEVAEVFLFFVVFSCPWDVTSCRHVCFSPRLHASVPCCSVVTGVRRTVRENPKALGS